MNRRTIATAILLVWFGSLSWLVGREYLDSDVDIPDETERSVPPSAEYYVVSMGDAQIGFASSTVDTVPEGLLVDDRLVLELAAGTELARAETRAVIRLSNTLRLQSFQATMRSDAGRYDARGTVSGDTLTIELEQGDRHERVRVALAGGVVFPAYLPLSLAIRGHLVVGNTVSVPTLDPLLLTVEEHEFTVVAESMLIVPDSAVFDSTIMRWTPALNDTVHAWRVRHRVGESESDAWLDNLGNMVYSDWDSGLSYHRTAFEIAFNNLQQRDRTEALGTLGAETSLVRRTLVEAHVGPAGAVVDRMRVRLSGPGLGAFDLAGDSRALDGGAVEVTIVTVSDTVSNFRLPYREDELGAYLLPTALIQSSDTRIQARARQAIDGTRSARRAAQRLSAWVGEHVERRVTPGMPSAVDVLTTGGGDSNEIALLYVAMARAVGIPARTAVGFVYVGGHFYYHAWPEIHLGVWTPVDPMLGQFPADASHLRLRVGGLVRTVEMLRLVGPVTLEVQEAGEYTQ